MKNVYLALAFATILASCSNSAKEDQLQSQQFTIDSLNKVAAQKESDRITAEKAVITEKETVVYHPVTTANPVTATPAPAKKKGMSNVAKGAIVGGVVGAGTGVAVSKDKLKGGIIGGVVGAGVGAGVGALIKKKE